MVTVTNAKREFFFFPRAYVRIWTLRPWYTVCFVTLEDLWLGHKFALAMIQSTN